MLSQNPMTISELAKPFDMSLPAASKHLKILQKSGLIHCEKVGRIHHCNINRHALESIQTWLIDYQLFWQDSLDKLAELVEQNKE
jgi:DNA-binding transcriptional ArsR family regulator